MSDIDITKHPLPPEPAAWFYGDEEPPRGPCDSKDEAISAAISDGFFDDNGDGTCKVRVGKYQRKQVNLAKYFDADDFLGRASEQIGDNEEGADDDGAKDPIEEIGPEDQKALEIAVRTAIWTWQRDHNLPLKSFWMDCIEGDVPETVPLPTEPPHA